MLAQELKLSKLMQQRQYITRQLSDRQDFGMYCIYEGHIFLDNIRYFEEEGFSVIRKKPDSSYAKTGEIPVYLIILIDDRELSEEEMEEAKKYGQKEAGEESLDIPEALHLDGYLTPKADG